MRESLAKIVFDIPLDKLRVISPDVGGGFGLRGKLFPESAMVLWAARRLGRPVKWRADRTETFVCDPHGRDHVTHAEMGFDKAGKITGMRVRTTAAMGAYLLDFGPRIPTLAGGRINGTVYDIQALNVQVRCVFTNTVSTDAYRGAGRPETAYVIERLLDQGAAEARHRARRNPPPQLHQAGADPLHQRRRQPLDSGHFAETQEMALDLADWAGFPARRAEAASAARSAASGWAISSRPPAASPSNGPACT